MSTLWLRLGAPWHPLRRAPRPRARHRRPWYLRGRFGTAKTERDATLATIDTVSRVYRIGHQISIRLRPTRGAATRDPSAQPRYHGISPRSLDLPVACARPSDRNSIDCARLRCPRALFVRSPPTIGTLPLLDPSASKSNIESGGPGSRDFRDRFGGLRGNFAAQRRKIYSGNLQQRLSAGVTFQPSVVFALFFHLDSRSGAWPTGLASRRGRRARRGEEGIVAGFDPLAIPPAPAPHDDTVSSLVPNVPAHPGRVSFSAVVSWLAARLELWEHAEVQPGLASSMAAPSVARACIAFPLSRSILPLDSCVWISLSMMMHHRMEIFKIPKMYDIWEATASPARCCSLQKVIRNRQVGARGDRPRSRGRPLPPPAPWTAGPDRLSHSP